ncbi:MAG: metallophosphoesterase [Pseudomonadota bacterium]
MLSSLRRLWRKRGPPPDSPPPPGPDPAHRIYAVGDVHGRHDLLEAMLWKIKQDARAQADERQPILVFLGDLVDRGDNSREVLDQVIAAWLSWPRTIVLRGNHEDALLSFLDAPEQGEAWLNYGGRQTFGSYGIPVPSDMPSADELHAAAAALARAMQHHADFLRKTETHFVSGHVVLSHAGLDPALPLVGQPSEAMIWGRSGFLDIGPPPGLRAVHGHWDAPSPVVTRHRICVDTGAYYTGRLTAVRLDAETEVLSVDALDL